MTLTFAAPSDAARPLHLVAPEDLDAFLGGLDAAARAFVTATGFAAKPGQVALIPGEDGPAAAVAGLGSPEARRRERFVLARVRAALPAGDWEIAEEMPEEARDEAALGWLLEGYRFDRYAAQTAPGAQLVAPRGCDAARIEAIAAGEALTRDLINTPACDMGPDALQAAVESLAQEFGAGTTTVLGDDLLTEGFPMIHAVGRAAATQPRLVEMRWGDAGPLLTLVGKGVCFDTGGLNLKPGSSMALMKKDMGGAATVLGLARTIMALKLPLRLRVLIPAVENAVSGGAFRPGDILTSRKGLTVEINNTDAEGRLVLADALALAAEEESALTVSMATLTGAARVAVGPDLAPFYTGDDTLAGVLSEAGTRAADPVWRMPFWDPYETMLEPGIADLDNAPKGGFAGSITAALFLRRFAPESYLHFDIYGWQPTAAPGRPKGGVGQGARALLQALPRALGL
ncbi:leucyl aminopeptidase family protein [Mesobaculum littorinae]|uniref:Leucyl aminopeptidase family protein n=1 Tax=Mesobaculum littorinae TaxID=2486419 RepID=A0A438AGE8_9RHOB|nr:leucyl aminopeptidase family protein [Mesobaculum littorinae]RVV97783.1 leucyl aminopeptidase family protein [Mesobaculum littorinae]